MESKLKELKRIWSLGKGLPDRLCENEVQFFKNLPSEHRTRCENDKCGVTASPRMLTIHRRTCRYARDRSHINIALLRSRGTYFVINKYYQETYGLSLLMKIMQNNILYLFLQNRNNNCKPSSRPCKVKVYSQDGSVIFSHQVKSNKEYSLHFSSKSLLYSIRRT